MGQLVVDRSRRQKQRDVVLMSIKRDTVESIIQLLLKKDNSNNHQGKVFNIATSYARCFHGSNFYEPIFILIPNQRLYFSSRSYRSSMHGYLCQKTNKIYIATTFCQRSKLEYDNTEFTIHSSLLVRDHLYGFVAYI